MISSHMTIQSFAIEMQMSIDCLIKQFLDMGITKTKFDFVSQKERELVLQYMNFHKIAVFNKFSLQRKTLSTLNISSVSGKNKKVQVEVRKKQVYMVKCSDQHINNHNLNLNSSNQDKKNEIYTNKTIDLIQNQKSNIIDNKNYSSDNSKEYSLDSVSFNKNLINIKNKSDNSINRVVNKIVKESDDSNKKQEKISNKSDIKSRLYYQSLKKTSTQLENSNSLDKIKNLFISNDTKKGNSKLENDRRNNFYRVRSKNRYIGGKSIKQKRYNSFDTYSHSIYESDQEEGSNFLYRTTNYKYKKKSDLLLHSFNKPVRLVPRNIMIDEKISVLELSNKMSVKSSYMIKFMMKLGLMVTINQILDQETAQLVIEEMGHNAILRRENALEELVMNDGRSINVSNTSNKLENKETIYENRAPIVTIMGHVDHGKTSLLDYIRSTKVAFSESGGITQNIGAYCVNIKGNMITFLDTPGHEAFTKMRLQGIQLTDIAILVIAADDGVMPQTIESIHHIQNFDVPIIVAINKIDKSKSNVDRIKHELNQYNLIPEEWGGNTQFVNVSAISGVGIDDLLDAILLQSEVLELKSIRCEFAKAVVIDSFIDKGRGSVSIVLVQEGQLKCGDIILCGTKYGRIRAMRDVYGLYVNLAGPSTPVELLGLSGTPDSGDILVVVRDEKKAKEVALYRQRKKRAIKLSQDSEKFVVKNAFDNINSIKRVPELNFIIKSNTQSAVNVIYESLKNLSDNMIIIKILSASVGDITETDAVLALASNAIILGFNVKADSVARNMIEINKLDVRYYSVIYHLIDSIKLLIDDILACKNNKFVVIGEAKVRNIFKSPIYGIIAGCIVMKGIIRLRKKIRVIRNDIIKYEGDFESLRHFKNDVHEVKNGMECGVGIKKCNDICVEDIIEVLDCIKK